MLCCCCLDFGLDCDRIKMLLDGRPLASFVFILVFFPQGIHDSKHVDVKDGVDHRLE